MSKKPNSFNFPAPTKEPKQKSINVTDLFLTRFSPPWARPPSLPAYTWRAWVLNQPVAMVCRETLISSLLSLDWKIIPRDMSYRQELAPVAKYYTKLLEKGGAYDSLQLDYAGLLEWIIGDLLDLPFGGAAEIGRKGDAPEGRVVWVKPLDAGTLYPTLNDATPIVQYYQGYNAVGFPNYSIARTYLSPQQYIYREGWGMAPPEKAYFAMDLLNRGDKYYANLLLDVPTAGILDLGDMEKESAEEWITAFRTFVNDTNTSFKIPVLYEHNNKTEFIPFGKVPNDIMFDTIINKYATLVCGAYGLSPTDIGMDASGGHSGGSLAGAIRQERKTRRTGFARVKTKWKSFIEQIIPDTLEFSLIDYDDELSVALGRARLSTSTAFNTLQTMKAFSPQELRSQVIADGLLSITLPDTLPPDSAFPEVIVPNNNFGNTNSAGNKPTPPKRPGQLGLPVAPSAGGEGEVKSVVVKSRVKPVLSFTSGLAKSMLPVLSSAIQGYGEDEIALVRTFVGQSLFSDGDDLGLQAIVSSMVSKKSLATINFDGLVQELEDIYGVQTAPYLEEFERNVKNGLNEFMGKAIAFTITDAFFDEEVIDKSDVDIYDYIIDNVNERINNTFESFALSFLSDEISKLIDKSRMEN